MKLYRCSQCSVLRPLSIFPPQVPDDCYPDLHKCLRCYNPDTPIRLCSKCNVWKVETDFSSRYFPHTGKQRQCKPCMQGISQAYSLKNVAYWKTHDPFLEHPTGEKQCSKCKKLLAVTQFYITRNSHDGLHVYCKKCQRRYRQTYIYGRAVETEVCEVCGRNWKLGIDHNHKTGKVRGVLWLNCNHALGMLHEDLSRIKALYMYLYSKTH